jgi:hypothetical protein
MLARYKHSSLFTRNISNDRIDASWSHAYVGKVKIDTLKRSSFVLSLPFKAGFPSQTKLKVHLDSYLLKLNLPWLLGHYNKE